MSRTVELKVTILTSQLAALGQFLGNLEGGAVASNTEATSTGATAGTVTTTPAATTETKPARRSRTTAANTTAATAETAKANEPAADEFPADYYDKTIKPVLVKLSSHKNGGREAAIAIVSKHGVKNAKDIPNEQLVKVLEQANAKLKELDAEAAAAEAGNDDDVSFE